MSSSSSDPVPKPVVDIKIQKVNNSCYYLTISCVVPDPSVNYSWRADSGPLPKELQTSVFNVTIGPQNYSKFYTCEVSNPVSNSSSTVPVTIHDSGKKYSQGSCGGHHVTSFLLSEEKCGDPIQPPGVELGGESQRHLSVLSSTHGSATTSPQTHLAFVELSVLTFKGWLAQDVPFSSPTLTMYGPSI